MSIEAYYPEMLSIKNIKINDFKDHIMQVNLEIGRFDGMLKYNPQKEIVQAFLRAEELLSAASLEISELSFDEYLDKFLDKGHEADDLLEISYIIDYYKEQDLIVVEKGFSLELLNKFQDRLVNNRNTRSLAEDELYRERPVWLTESTKEADLKLHKHNEEERINELIENLDDFIRKSKLYPLVTAAIAYGQLAMIHPCKYVNGEITGALIPYMYNYLGITKERSFYLSAAFSKDKAEYYRQLLNLFKKGDWQTWINYFLSKVKEQSLSNQRKIDRIIEYYEGLMEYLVEEFSDSKKLSYYIESLLSNPIFTPRKIEKKTGMPSSSLNKFVGFLEDHKFIVRENKENEFYYIFTEIYDLYNI